VQRIIAHLHETGKLVLEGDRLSKQPSLPFENPGVDNAR
jgi:hypothetical protein